MSYKRVLGAWLSFVLLVATLTVIGPNVSRVSAAGANLLTNPGFEDGTTSGWVSMGSSTIAVSTTQKYAGTYSALVSDRQAEWNGIGQSLLSSVQLGNTYDVVMRVRLQNTASDAIKMSLRKIEAGETDFATLTQSTASNTEWTELRGSFSFNPSGSVTDLFVYLEGAAAGTSFFVDEAEVTLRDPIGWKTEANARIEQIRKRNAEIRVVNASGEPVSGASVSVRQKKHHFGFGSAINTNVLTNTNYANFFKENFEWAVHENEAKWYSNETSQGNVNYTNADRILDWTEANGIISRGHTVVWEVEQYQPSWVKNLTGTALRTALDNRITSAVNHFKGRFEHWDVNNEMLHGSFYKDRLGSDIWSYMYTRTHELDPDVQLFVNDYNVIEYAEDNAYKQQIQGLLNQGAPIGGIGAQGHFGETVDPVTVKQRLDNLATLGLPIWISEYDSTQPDVNLRADNLEALYRTAFSHPAVEGIMMWGFWEGSHWRSNAHIVNNDWTINEAGKRYQALMKEWTTSLDGVTGADGKYAFRGFHGTYEVTVTAPGATAVTKTFELDPGTTTLPVTVTIGSEDGGGGTPTVPSTPAGLAASPGNTQTVLTWGTATGATGYNVKRSTTSGGPYTVVAAGVNGTSYTDTGLTNGTSYYYVVSAINSAGESMNSAQVTATPIGGNGGGETAGQLVVQYKAGDTNINDNQIKPHLNIKNTGTTSVDLSKVKVRYYFTKDGNQTVNAWVDYARIGASNLQLSIGAATGSNADTYIQVAFSAGAGTLAPGAQTGEIQLRLAKADWSNFNEGNDYSFDQTKTAFSDWNKVTLYADNNLVWGIEP